MNFPAPKATNTPPDSRRRTRSLRSPATGCSACLWRGSVSRAQELVRDPGRERVDRVVKGVDRDLLLRPEDRRRGDLERRQHDLRVAVNRGPVERRGLLRGQAALAEETPEDPPARAESPVREVVEARLRDIVLELRDPQHLRRRARRRRARRPPPEPCLDRARDRHRRRTDDSGDQALADRACQRARRFSHDPTSSGTRFFALPSAFAAAAACAGAPSRSSRWSPTRRAFAIAVRAGFTALDDGKKLVSTT